MIVFLTDFGHCANVGVMKGVFYDLCPAARIVDLCHDRLHLEADMKIEVL